MKFEEAMLELENTVKKLESGETTLEDYKKSDVKPDYILSSVKDILEAIK